MATYLVDEELNSYFTVVMNDGSTAEMLGKNLPSNYIEDREGKVFIIVPRRKYPSEKAYQEAVSTFRQQALKLKGVS